MKRESVVIFPGSFDPFTRGHAAVVDEALRGSGLGRRLVEHAIGYCREEGIDTVYLTSNPKRVAANALYQSVGFVRKETNMYKMDLKK